MKWIVCIILTAFSLACIAGKSYPEISALFSGYIDSSRLDRGSRGNIHPVSMIRLMTDASFEGKHISFNGVLSCSDERPMVFINNFSYKVFDTTEVIYLPQMPVTLMDKCSNNAEGEAVTVFGKFVRPDPKTDDVSIGRLKWVSAITFSGVSFDKSPVLE
ncbi:hypothetical protein [Marinimicrobium sp. ARAG 43.8]|uniref:hypothetical protein n=1 Tax=Marinimicrobium sp. ARAG 43.8 TaxID=3418719 RepID=UPI003CEF2214